MSPPRISNCSVVLLRALILATAMTSMCAGAVRAQAQSFVDALQVSAELRVLDLEDPIEGDEAKLGFFIPNAFADADGLRNADEGITLALRLDTGLHHSDEFQIHLRDDVRELEHDARLRAFGLVATLGIGAGLRFVSGGSLRAGIDLWHREVVSDLILAGAAEVDASWTGNTYDGLSATATLDLSAHVSAGVQLGYVSMHAPSAREDAGEEGLRSHRLALQASLQASAGPLALAFSFRELHDGTRLNELERAHCLDLEIALSISETWTLRFEITNLTNAPTTLDELPILSPIDPGPQNSIAAAVGDLDVDEIEGRRFMLAIVAEF